MLRSILPILSFILLLASCKSPEARRPIKSSSGSFIKESVERNKKLYEAEEGVISEIMKENPQNDYVSSDTGFWYFYNSKDSIVTKKPQLGDEVTFTFNIKDLNGNLILSEEENGIQRYRIDQSNQDLISGIRDGLKLMEEGETVTFLFPSHKAYGYYGLADKLGANIPVQSTVTLKSIITQDN